jgi:hypothetical protein
MRTKTLPIQACFNAIAAIARWLPDAPREPAPLIARLTELLRAELPPLEISIALNQGDGWLLYGTTSPAAHDWLASLSTIAPSNGTSRKSRRSGDNQPYHGALIEPISGSWIGVAVWEPGVSAAAFDALLGQPR